MDQPLILGIELAPPPAGAPPEILATITLSTNAQGIRYSGDLLQNPLREEEEERLRWYLEEYWQWPYEQFRTRAQEVEALLPQIGQRLYQALFGSAGAQQVLQPWRLQPGKERQISIVSDIPRVLSLPWELLHDEQGFLALRTQHPVSIMHRLTLKELPALPTAFTPPLRILLVTARPDDAGFVDPRSIARELLEEIAPQVEAGTVALEFLRPPTLPALRERLRDRERPAIHVLHFDGHGAFGAAQMPQDGLRLLSSGPHGMLAFENEEGKANRVSAEELAQVLQDSGVRLAVFTACQSAQGAQDDVFSSVLVASATRYVEAFYRALANGEAVPLAQERARQALHDDPRRHLSRRHRDEEGEPVRLSDWWLPHYYQQRPLLLEPTTSASADGSPARARKEQSFQDATLPMFNQEMPAEPRYGFSGRSRELLQIERALLQRKLVVISGFGGMGKTALAREAADWFTRTRFYQRACFVSFEQGVDAVLLLATLGHFLSVYDGTYNPNDAPDALAKIQQALRKQRILLIADNLESILPGGEAPLVPELRSQLWTVLLTLRKQGAGVLLTTRDTDFGEGRLAHGKDVLHLRLAGLASEDAYLLASRALTDLGIERARAPYGELRGLLAQLENHPLAIYLVMPALREHPLAQVRAEFDRLLPTFVDDTASGRNRSLLASLDYSLRRLGEEQRVLLGRLTIFEGRASEDDLLAITQIPEQTWAKLRMELEQAALLLAEQPHPDVAVPFLHFHPVLLPSLRSQPGIGQVADLHERYVRRYYDVANYLFHQDFQHPEPVRAMARRELPNLRRALTLLLEQGYLEESSRLSDSLAHFLTIFGLLREREQWREHIARGMAEQGEQDDRTLTHAEYLYEIGQAQDERGRGNVRMAEARLSELLARIEAQPNGTRISPGSFVHVRTLQELDRCLQDAKQFTAAEVRSREALAMVERLLEKEPDEHTLLHVHTGLFGDLGSVLMGQGKYVQAKEAYEQALKGYTALQETRNVAAILGLLGVLAREQKDYVEARSLCLQSMERFEALEEPAEEATGWYNLGLVAMEVGNWSEAEHCLRESLILRERLGSLSGSAECCNVLAGAAERAGRPEEAEGWYRGALERIERVERGGIKHSMYLSNLAGLLVKEVLAGRAPKVRLVEARQFAEQALQIEERPGISTDTWTIFNLLAWIALLEEDREMVRYYRLLERKSFAAFAGNRSRIDQQHGALIAAVAQAARGDKAQRTAVEAAMPQLEQAGWHLGVAVERIWAGEREWHTLVDKLDSHDALLILRVLETLEQPSSRSPTKEEVQAEGELLTSLPQAAQEALARGDEVAFRQAFEVLSPEEQRQVATMLEALLHWREAAGEDESGTDTSFLSQFEPLLQAIAAQRHELEQVLKELESQGWHLKQAVERLWAGERDAEVLTEGLDEQDSALIARVLELLATRDSSSAG